MPPGHAARRSDRTTEQGPGEPGSGLRVASCVARTFGLGLATVLAVGCALPTGTSLPELHSTGIQGRVHGGQQPIANATMQLYAAGQNGVAAAATPLLTRQVATGNDGEFTLAGLYTCPSAGTPVYLVARGGNPGLFNRTNPAIVLMAALGPCGNVDASTEVTLNEVTTVSAVYSLAAFMESYDRLGTDPSLTTQFGAAWAQAAQLGDLRAGAAPLARVLHGAPAPAAVPVAKINTIANILATCINSGGGSAGDGSLCGQLFASATSDGRVPTDTAGAVLQMARHPSLNARQLFGLLGPVAPFSPALTAAPEDWGLFTSAGIALASPVLVTTPDPAPDEPVVPVTPVDPVGPVNPVTPPDSPAPVPPVVPVSPPVVPPVSVPNAALTLSSAVLDVGRVGAGTITLSAGAPAGGVSVALNSSGAGVMSLPQTVTIAGGESSTKFFYTGTAVGATVVSASADGFGSAAAPLSVQLPVAQASMFGLSVLDYNNVSPHVTYGTTRSWDAYPGLDWADANPAPGVYEFGPLNTFIAVNQARGADILHTFGRTPQWASQSPNTPGFYFPGQCGAPSLSAWDAYVTAIVTASAGRIRYWELWNEPDYGGTWCSDIPTLVTMAQHAYRIIKTIDPAAMVLSPAASGGAGASWLANFLNQGGKGTFDIVAFHGYEGTIAEAINPIANVYRNAMWWFGIQELPLWDTECSWGNNPIGDDAHRAAFLAKYFVLQWSNGVDRTLWYAYDGLPEWGRMIDYNQNLLPDGVAYAQVRNWILGATLTQPCAQEGDGTWRCGIRRPGGYSGQILWNSNGTATNVAVPAGMARVRDLNGNAAPFYGGGVSVGNMPVLFESGTP